MSESSALTPTQAFGRVLRELRLAKKFSQETLAFEANLERNFISLLERAAQTPSLNTLYKLSAALGLKPSTLIALVELQCPVKPPKPIQ